MKLPDPITIDGYPHGMNNRAAEFALPEGCARNLVNVDVKSSGKVRRRVGYTRLVADAGAHSVFSNGTVAFYVAAGVLKQLDPSTGATTVLDAAWGDAKTAYHDVGGEVYMSNGLKTAHWMDELMPWGVPVPPRQPSLLALPTGGMYEGTYQVAVTWRDRDGVESGTGLATSVDVVAGGGILVSDFPPPPAEIAVVAVYCSPADGGDLYLDGDYNATYTSSLILEQKQRTIPLVTQFKGPMPPCSILESHGGRIYGAQGSILYFTAPFNPGLAENLEGLVFEDTITALLSVTDGFYVMTKDRAYFVTDEDLDGPPTRHTVTYDGAIPGTTINDVGTNSGYWLSKSALTQGDASGQSRLVTEAHVAFPNAAKGAIALVDHDGERFAIISTSGCTPNPLVSEEWATSEVARKGNFY